MFDPTTHGFSDIDMAKKCFTENYNNYHNDPEKFNLYKGLVRQAAAIEQMQKEIIILREQMNALLLHLSQRG
jgi:hypothetical protein